MDVYDPTTGADPQPSHRRHRLLVHRHRLQRRELLRPPRLLLPAPTSPTRSSSERLRAEIDEAEWSKLYSDREPALRHAEDGQDRGEGHQPLRRRGAEGVSASWSLRHRQAVSWHVRSLLSGLPATFPVPILIVQHRSTVPSVLESVLRHDTQLSVVEVVGGNTLTAGTVFVAPADHHLLLDMTGVLRLSDSAKVHHVRPAADPLFAVGGRLLPRTDNRRRADRLRY